MNYKPEYENYIDLQLYKLVDVLNPIFYGLNFTPNDITSLSTLFIFIFFYYYKKGLYVEGSICYFISYFFDCMDGIYARKYNMTSKFGEYYDHFKDVITNGIAFYLFYKNDNITIQFKKYLMIIFITLTICSQMYLNCRDKNNANANDNPEDEDYKVKIPLECDNVKDLKKLKYLGSGTKYLTMSLMIWLHEKYKNN